MNKRSNNNTKSKNNYKKKKGNNLYEYCSECNSELDGYYYTKCVYENKVVCNYCFEELYDKSYNKSGYGEQFNIPPPPPIIQNDQTSLNTDTNKLGIFFSIKNNDNKK